MKTSQGAFGLPSILYVLLGLLVAVPGLGQNTDPWVGDVFAAALLGEWTGEGVVYGNEVTLDRSWALDLEGQYLRGDMGVTMGNGFGFRALTYWQPVAPGRYAVTWLDEAGDTRHLTALSDPDGRAATIHYLDEPESGSAEWRRIVYRITGEHSYEELLQAERSGSWVDVARFAFTRGEKETGASAGAADPPDEVATIQEQSRRLSEAYVRGDIEALVDLYLEDGVAIPGGSEPVRGREALLRLWALPEGRTILRHVSEPTAIDVDGDRAYDWGHYEGQAAHNGEPLDPFRGTYLIVWQRNSAGEWKMAVDMWSRLTAD
jgi:ketosteroid isomerase-like protein